MSESQVLDVLIHSEDVWKDSEISGHKFRYIVAALFRTKLRPSEFFKINAARISHSERNPDTFTQEPGFLYDCIDKKVKGIFYYFLKINVSQQEQKNVENKRVTTGTKKCGKMSKK